MNTHTVAKSCFRPMLGRGDLARREQVVVSQLKRAKAWPNLGTIMTTRKGFFTERLRFRKHCGRGVDVLSTLSTLALMSLISPRSY